MWVRSLGWEHPLEEGAATHSSILVWRMGYSPWGRQELDTTEHAGTWMLQMLVKRCSVSSRPRCSTGMQPAWPCLGCPAFCLHQVVPSVLSWLHRDPGQSRCQKMTGQKTKDV